MNDKNFDEQSANEWIELIESEKADVRDQDIYPGISSWIQINKFEEVLDLGAGQGVAFEKIDFSGALYFGVEPSPYLLNRAKQKYRSASFVQGNAYSLPFDDGEFAGVFSIAVWHLLEDIDLASKELSRVLKDSGRFLLIMASSDHSEVWSKGTENDTIYLRTFEEVKASLEKNGLHVESHKSIRHSVLIEGYKI